MKKNKEIIRQIKAARHIARKEHFESGGTLHEWLGGVHLVTANKKRYNRKSKHKGKGY